LTQGVDILVHRDLVIQVPMPPIRLRHPATLTPTIVNIKLLVIGSIVINMYDYNKYDG